MKKAIQLFFRIVFSRTAVVIVSLAIQVGILALWFLRLQDLGVYIAGGFTLFSAVLVIYIINERTNPSFKLAWIIPILVFPFFGGLLYLFIQIQFGTKMIAARLKTLETQTKPYLAQNETVMHVLRDHSTQVANLAHYVGKTSGFPIYGNTRVTYFPSGEAKFEELKKQLLAAKYFIFMEYFIVEEGLMWNSILDILEQKVKEGVEVRFMYDGMCSLVLLPYHYPKKLQKMGIACKMFSPIKPALSTHQNNRDHRKIVVIDGHTAFTGGINLADEYINHVERFGHWKDVAVMLQGDAANSFTMMFLQMWNVTERKEENYEKYLSSTPQTEPDLGYVMPYGDSPLDKELVGELVYMDIIYKARKYVHIMTPYLILDNEMLTALTFAAKSGIDVKIMMPHIPDKWYAFVLAKTYYWELLEAGVKIYEYTPGFVHAKVFVSDDICASVGTINLDFRSLYLHFECAAFLYQNPAVLDIEADFQQTLAKCQAITYEDCRRQKLFNRLAGRVLRLFAPLM